MKIYRATVESPSDFDHQQLMTISTTFKAPVILQQKTPTRVLHRRADLIRKKTVYQVKILESSKNHALLEIEAEGGTYIKEFISGDQGRTIPSVTSTIQIEVVCTELDVIKVDDHGLFS